MTESAVRKILLDDIEHPKDVRLDDGRVFRVRGVEYWAAAETNLIVIDRRVGQISFPYRKIASIRTVPKARRRKAAR